MRHAVLGVVSALALAAPAAAADPAAPDPLAATRRVLDVPGDFAYDNVSLAGVIADLRDRAKLPIALDSALAQSGIDPNGVMVTGVNLKGVKLRDGLRAVLEPFNLRFGVVRDGLFVSTEDGLTARQLRQRVDVDGEAAPFAATVRKLAAGTGANVVLDPRLKDRADAPVALKLDDVPLETAVRLLAEVADLRAVRLNNVLFVTTPERAARLRPDADGPVPAPGGNPFLPGIQLPAGGGVGFAVPLNPPPGVEAPPVDKN
ncbi:MAG: hypothetical protein K2X87_27175 [Gemmataceae bacterium]|nr:hypothetical protein [Gemmataceae bacterium]